MPGRDAYLDGSLATFRRKNSEPSLLASVACRGGSCKIGRFCRDTGYVSVLVAFHCTANSMAEGMEGEARILDTVKSAGAERATTTARAICQALDTLAARRLVLVTPYSAKTTEEEAEFLHRAGYEVLHAEGLALAGSDAYCNTPAEFWRDRAIAAARADADVYFLSCANISTFPVIDEIERATGKPAISSNQVVVWEALRQLGWRDRSGCPGRLFDSIAKATPEPVAAR